MSVSATDTCRLTDRHCPASQRHRRLVAEPLQNTATTERLIHLEKVKFCHTRYRALGPELIPVYRQSARRWREVNHAIDLAVCCRYFLPLPPLLSPDGATCKRQHASDSSLLLIYRPRKDERLSWPSWMTCSGWLTHISGHPSAAGREQDRESSPVRDRLSTTVPCHQLMNGVKLKYGESRVAGTIGPIATVR